MNRRILRRQTYSLSLCFVLLATVMEPCSGFEKPETVPGEEVDNSVIAALSHQGSTEPKVIAHIDLTGPFGTATQWTFVAVQENGQPPVQDEDHGPVLVCLVKAIKPDCTEHFYQQASSDKSSNDKPHHLFESRVVYGGQSKSSPLLFVQVCTAEMFDGNCGVATALYKYDRQSDRFIRVFLNVTGRNNNEETRFVEQGPIQGDVIVNYPTEHAPYTYWIEVYRAGESGRYARILRYRSHTGYNDGNPLAVADSEMPEILHRLGLWRPGDSLPVPPDLPEGCSHPFMRHGEEWCKR